MLFFSIIFLSCNERNKKTIITGDIPNLPDGILYLYEGNANNRIDSIITKNGKFTLTYILQDDKTEPVYLGLDHLDKKGVLRATCFTTNGKFRGSGFKSSTFLSDPTIILKGSITDFIRFSEREKIVLIPKIKAGYQTNALFHTDGDLFDNINDGTYNKVLSKIKEYQNSFHLLYKINDNRNSFSAIQIQSLLNSFKGEIVESKTFKALNDYNEKRFDKKKLTVSQLTDNNGKKTDVLDTKFKKHLVVFWASWCGPCRQEIPSLKKIYSKYKNNIEFVSISTDTNNSLWQKALGKEEMSWKQFIINEKSKEYEPIEILFQVSNSIPYIALLDNNKKVIKSHVGLMTEIELEKFLED